jgi:hypothetical protein
MPPLDFPRRLSKSKRVLRPCASFVQAPALSGAEGVGILTFAALPPLPNPASPKLAYVSLGDW